MSAKIETPGQEGKRPEMEIDVYEEAGARGWCKPSASGEKAVEWVYRAGALSLFGNTYPIKEKLKELGFRWDFQRWKKKPCTPQEALSLLEKLEALGIVLRAYV